MFLGHVMINFYLGVKLFSLINQEIFLYRFTYGML